jgi:hypothetical protein
MLSCLRCSRVSVRGVREVYKVMAPVDHDLTIVNCFDHQLGLIKNLGCHIDAPSLLEFKSPINLSLC